MQKRKSNNWLNCTVGTLSERFMCAPSVGIDGVLQIKEKII